MTSEYEISPSEYALDEMCNAIIESIEPRGQKTNADTRIGCIVRDFFDRAKRKQTRPLTWWEVWEKCWPEEYSLHKDDEDLPEFTFGQKVRSTMARVRDLLDRLFVSDKGNKFSFRAVLERGVYRLRFYRNEPDLFQAKPMRPIGKRTTVGLVFGRKDEFFQSDLIAGTEMAARREGYRLVVTFNSNDFFNWDAGSLTTEADHVESLSKQCAGLIVVPSVDEYVQVDEFAKPYRRLIANRYPFVFAARRTTAARP